jgi:hypothetical protein
MMNDQPGACSNGGAQWIFPTSHPKSLDHRFEGNVFKRRPNFDIRCRRWRTIALPRFDPHTNSRSKESRGLRLAGGGQRFLRFLSAGG